MKNYFNRIKSYEGIKSFIATAFVLIMTGVFPLYLTDKYFNIRHDKLYFFYVMGASLSVAITIVYLMVDKRSTENKLQDCKNGLKKMSVVDYSVVVFGTAVTISAMLSDDFKDSLTGNGGRNNGLIIVLLYVIMYFIISRTYVSSRAVTTVLCIVSGFMSFLAVVQQFYWNPLELFDGLSMEQCKKFISTIGNRNLFTAYLCITLPLCFIAFIYSKRKHSMTITALAVMFNFAGMICSNSDNVFLGLAGLFIFLFVLYVRELKHLSRCFFLVTIMLLSCKLVRIFSYFMDDYYMDFSQIQKYLIYGNTYIVMVMTALASLGLYILGKRKVKVPRVTQKIALAFVVASLIGVAALVFYYSVVDTKTNLSGAMQYLRFDDSWGTHRGFMWIRALYIYADLNILEKIFGTGPDSFKAVMDNTGYNNELFAYKNEVTDCAHNVYLNYMVTIGLAGTLSYITTIVSAGVRGIRRVKSNKYVVMFTGAVICYALQAIVNIDQPITTPLFILTLAILEAENRKVK